jgi:hypothetical protein
VSCLIDDLVRGDRWLDVRDARRHLFAGLRGTFGSVRLSDSVVGLGVEGF